MNGSEAGAAGRGGNGRDPSVVALARAYDRAARAHAGQQRKGLAGNPYLNHLCEVAHLVAEATGGNDPEIVIAAVLHDIVEDTGATTTDIAVEFGDRVATIVAEVTDAEELDAMPLPEKKARQAREMGKASAAGKIVKLADQTSNVRGLVEDGTGWTTARNRAYLDGARQVVDACRGASPPLAAEFDAAAAALEAYIVRLEDAHTRGSSP